MAEHARLKNEFTEGEWVTNINLTCTIDIESEFLIIDKIFYLRTSLGHMKHNYTEKSSNYTSASRTVAERLT